MTDVHEFAPGKGEGCAVDGCGLPATALHHRWRYLDQAGRTWQVPYGVKPSGSGACRRCAQMVLWARMPDGKRRPLNAAGNGHFATCAGRSGAARSGAAEMPPWFDGIELA